jgi:hypothetical protein
MVAAAAPSEETIAAWPMPISALITALTRALRSTEPAPGQRWPPSKFSGTEGVPLLRNSTVEIVEEFFSELAAGSLFSSTR